MSLKANKQEMKYSSAGQKITIYETDDEGNRKFYETSDGEKIYYTKKVDGFSEPVSFMANISNKLSEVLVKEFGIDDSTSYCQITTDKGYLPIKSGDYIWKKSDVGHTKEGLVDILTADYIVKGVADEGLTVDLFLLQKTTK